MKLDSFEDRYAAWERRNTPTPMELANYREWKRNNSGNKWAHHKGKAYYDRERMQQKLRPDSGQTLLPPTGELAAWIAKHCPDVDCTTLDKCGVFLKESWPCGRFHGGPTNQEQRADGAERVTDEYRLERIESKPKRDSRGTFVCFPWQVTFNDGARFNFRTLAMAEAGITELLKRRKAKHPKPAAVTRHSTSPVFFTAKRQRELPEDVYAEPAKAKPKRKRSGRKTCRRELVAVA